jgi:hypothetical protein
LYTAFSKAGPAQKYTALSMPETAKVKFVSDLISIYIAKRDAFRSF